ncbi:hypothetical protein QCA50_000327 [Cerrena zonata]|uniref:Uncharacterized protein n=1 Tax=Cerrena zonata TaxID=2478898 RepID=A0AAW0GQB7_9APHY
MTALPSFVELMASLGIDNTPDAKDKHPQTPPFPHHSRSSSYSSTTSSIASFSSNIVPPSHTGLYRESSPAPAIFISRHRNSSGSSDRDENVEIRRHRARFSPYAPVISHVRRGSMPLVSSDEEQLDQQPSRAYSTSPSPNLAPRSVGRRQSALGLKRPEKLNLADPELLGNMPISTYVRRKTPQTSPISPTFPHRARRAASPAVPVSIPKLPTFIFPTQPPLPPPTNQSSDTEDDDMGLSTDSNLHLRTAREVYAAGALRSLRHSDSKLPLRPSPVLEGQRRTPIPPIA